MRCVSLKDITKFVRDFSCIDYYNQFKPNELKYREMWQDQGPEFWVKFVVVLKYHIKDATELYDDIFERDLAIFLKALTHKKFNEIKLFVTNAAQRHYNFVQTILKSRIDTKENVIDKSPIAEMKNVIALTFLAGSFLQVLPVWESADPGNNFDFQVPISWFMPDLFPKVVPPLEALIRSKWGGSQNVEEILGTKPQAVKWWKDPAQQQSVIPLTSHSMLALPLEISNLQLQQSKCLKLGVNDLIKIYLQINNLKCGEKQYWMENLPSITTMSDVVDQNLLNSMKQLWEKNELSKFYKVLEHCFPPLLHQKYHKIDVLSLACPDLAYLKVASWFTVILGSLGDEFTNRLHTVNQDFIYSRASDASSNFSLANIDEIIKSLDETKRKFGAVRAREKCVENLSDFLFEPCVLIELPSQPVLLRQWLSAALIIILKFELELVEFRHLPIPQDIEPLIRELISIVINTKERILLTFVTLSFFGVTTYPSCNSRIYHTIMDDFILKSIPILKFISTEDSIDMVKRLKHECFVGGHSFSICVQLHENIFNFVNPVVKEFYPLFFGHFLFWANNHKKISMFKKSEVEESEFLVNTKYLLKNRILEPPRHKAFYLNGESLESNVFLNGMFKDLEHIEINVLDTVKKIIISCGYFLKQDCDKFLMLLTKKTEETPPYEDACKQCFISARAYALISTYICLHKDESGILSCMNRLTAQVFAKDHMMRLIAACTILLEQVPRVCDPDHGKGNISKSPALSKKSISTTLKSLQEDSTEKQTRDSLWSQFPEDWKQPVDSKLETPPFDADMVTLIKGFQTRIGRLVWNATNIFFKIRKQYTPFHCLGIIHYLLPPFVSSLTHAERCLELNNKNVKFQLETIEFMNKTLHFYELCFDRWVHSFNNLAHLAPVNLSALMLKHHILDDYSVKMAMFSLHGYLGMDDIDGKYTGGVPHIKLILQSMPSYPFSQSEITPRTVDFHQIEPRYASIPLTLFKVGLTLQSYFPSMANKEIYCPQLHEFYCASMIIYRMLILIRCQNGFNDLHTDDKSCFAYMLKEMDALMYDLFSILSETETRVGCERQVKSFIEGKRIKFLQQFFNFLIDIRKKYGQNFEKVSLEKVVPCFEQLKASKEVKDVMASFFDGKLTSLKLFANRYEPSLQNSCQMTEMEAPEDQVNEKKSSINCNQRRKFNSFRFPTINLQVKMSSTELTTVESSHQLKAASPANCTKQRKNTNKISLHAVNSSQLSCTETTKDNQGTKLAQISISKIALNKSTSPASNGPSQMHSKSVKPDKQYFFNSNAKSKCANTNKTETCMNNAIKPVKTEQNCTCSASKEAKRPITLNCNNCGTVEIIPGSFVVCTQCIKQNYPITNYFCDTTCQEKWWHEEHEAEHLEFELGLFDIAAVISS